MGEKRNETRKDFPYYMRMADAGTKTLIGHLADVSTGGFKLDSDKPIPADQNFHIRLELTKEVSLKSFILLRARSKWCRTDPIDPLVYNVGFHISEINPLDIDILNRVIEYYGKEKKKGIQSAILGRTKGW